MAEMAGGIDLDGLEQEVNNMSDTHEDAHEGTQEDRRKSDRRKSPRRTYDLLHDVLDEEERQQYDKMLWQTRRTTDRRATDRRSGEDRRKG